MIILDSHSFQDEEEDDDDDAESESSDEGGEEDVYIPGDQLTPGQESSGTISSSLIDCWRPIASLLNAWFIVTPLAKLNKCGNETIFSKRDDFWGKLYVFIHQFGKSFTTKFRRDLLIENIHRYRYSISLYSFDCMDVLVGNNDWSLVGSNKRTVWLAVGIGGGWERLYCLQSVQSGPTLPLLRYHTRPGLLQTKVIKKLK